jgi:serine/threonine protein phosphatase PrpC
LRILLETPDLSQAASQLIARANDCGGPDNVTVVLARWMQG